MTSRYWKIYKTVGYKKSMLKIGYPETSVNAILDIIEEAVLFPEVIKQKFFFIGINQNGGFEWNPTEPIFIQMGYTFNGSILLRKEKLEKLNYVANKKQIM